MKLKQKIIALNVTTLFIMLIALGIIITAITDNYNLQTVLRYLESQGDYAAVYIEQYAINKAPNVFEVPNVMRTNASFLSAVLKETAKCRVQIFYGNERLGDSEPYISTDTSVRPEIKETLNKSKAYYIKKGKSRVFYYAVPVSIGDKYVYSVGFIYPLTETDNMKANTINMFLMTGLLSALLVTLGSTFISNKMTDPIKSLNEATKRFSKGDLECRAVADTRDEIGELSSAFNAMADNIQDKISKLNYEKEKQKYFFDNFTHEIRTPLTTIIGYAELLWKTDDSEVRDKSLFYITSEGKRMLKMMERLLELSKLKKYSFEVHRTPTDLKKLIEDVCESLQYKARRYNTAFRLNLQNVTHPVDPDLVKQLIINIIDNSIKYSKSPVIDILLKKQNGVELVISDYGCGIDEKNLENIFDPYYKVDKSRNSQIEGWGLGLSIAKEIADKHEGTIKIQSAVGKGTSVIVTL